jgi:hypothetical protein
VVSPEVRLEGSILAAPIDGREKVWTGMRTSGGITGTLSFTHESTESDGSYLEWELEALRTVIAGHKNKDPPDDPAILAETRHYLQDVIRLLDDKPAAREFFDQMIALYPDRLNPFPVWWGASGLLGG